MIGIIRARERESSYIVDQFVGVSAIGLSQRQH